MPDASRVQWSKLKVGVLGLAAFFILAVLIFLLTSSKGLFRQYAVLRTYMSDAGGIADGSVVRLNGISVGYLDHLKLNTSPDPNRTVEFDMKVKPEYLSKIPVDSVVEIAEANVLGDKFLNITQGKLLNHTVRDGDELASKSTKDIGQMMASMGNVLTSFQSVVNRVNDLLVGVEQGKGNIGLFLKDDELYRRLNAIASEGQSLLTDVRKGKGSLSLFLYNPDFYNQTLALEKRVDSMLADLQAGQGTAGKFLHDPALYDEAQKTITEIHGLIAQINSGKGTAGRFIKDDTLSRRLDELVARFETTMDKINSGQGTVGQLMVNPQLYDTLTGTTKEFQSLAKDIRANPKKFLTIRLTLF